MADDSEAHQQIFFGLTYTIIPSEKITAQHAAELRDALLNNGARYTPLTQDGGIDELDQHTHIISTHIDFPEYNAALDHNCHVVKPSWVEQSLIKRRLVQARQHSPDPALIFQDVIVTFGDLPQGDKDAITAGVIAMGGMYSPAMTKLVTHIVTLTENSDKVNIVKKMKLSTRVVLPHWFDDCLKLGKKIGEAPYILPDPEILGAGSFTARRIEAQPDLAGAVSAFAGDPPRMTPPQSSPRTPSTPRKRLNVFTGKRIFFDKDLDVHDQLADTLAELSTFSGGILTTDVEDCDVYVGQFREGPDYILASRSQKIVGNLSWFYDVITRNHWTSPLKRLLHYPIPKEGIPGFKDMKISLSNYTGDARLYLENIITTAGGEFTKTMRQDNTHLVTAHRHSEKCDAAQEWNINIINHLWLEESYARCEVQSLTNTRYTHFPPRTNLSEIVGQTPIDIERVEAFYFTGDDDQIAQDDGGSESSILQKKEVKIIDTAPERLRTPSARSKVAAGKENEAPPSTARASKTKAAAQLEKAAVDIAAFEKEMKRKGGVTHGRKRGSDDIQQGEDSREGEEEDVEGEMGPPRSTKKVKTSKDSGSSDAVSIKYKILLTGDDRWTKPKKEAEDKKTLRSLGIQVVTSPIACNLLCAPRILRTRKFVMAVSSGPDIVSTGYLDHVLKHKTLPDFKAYRLQDREMETKYEINLAESVQRAKDNDHKLLRGWHIYVTDKVVGGFDTFKDIMEANGGIAIPYRGKKSIQIPRRRLGVAQDPEAGAESQNQGGDEELDYVYLISGTSDEETKLWPTFKTLAASQKLEARIVKTDWILNCAMAQRVEWNEQWELTE